MTLSGKLSNATLAAVGARPNVTVPQYSRADLAPGIVHLGLGAFHRAHAAVYTDRAIADVDGGGDKRWGIVGVSLPTPATHWHRRIICIRWQCLARRTSNYM